LPSIDTCLIKKKKKRKSVTWTFSACIFFPMFPFPPTKN
jgi:hypothetical protein